MTQEQWSPEVVQVLESLSKLPNARYAFVPGFGGNPKGNSQPGSAVVKKSNGEFFLAVNEYDNTTPLSEIFEGYTLSVVTDSNGYKCIQGVDKYNHIRELAPSVAGFYHGNEAAETVVREELRG